MIRMKSTLVLVCLLVGIISYVEIAPAQLSAMDLKQLERGKIAGSVVPVASEN